jgi:Zn-dependent protease with chaperone function
MGNNSLHYLYLFGKYEMKQFFNHSILPWLKPADYSASTKNWAKGVMAFGLVASGTGSLAFIAGGMSALYSTIAINSAITFLTAWYSKEIVFWFYSIKPVTPGELVEGFDLHAMVKEIASHPKIACSMPALGIYETEKLNAFATGRHKGHSGVAVTRGLLKYAREYIAEQGLSAKFTAEDLIKGVLFHEMGHVAHRDIALQSAISILSLVFTKLCHSAYDKVFKQPEDKNKDNDKDKNKNKVAPSAGSKWIVPTVFVLGWTGSHIANLLSKWFSRTRETCADETAFECQYGPQLAEALRMLEIGSKKDKIEAPAAAKSSHFFGQNLDDSPLFCHHEAHDSAQNKDKTNTKGKKKKGCITWAFEAFSSHPAIEDRIAHLETLEREAVARKPAFQGV